METTLLKNIIQYSIQREMKKMDTWPQQNNNKWNLGTQRCPQKKLKKKYEKKSLRNSWRRY
jgi:hypothetical protein